MADYRTNHGSQSRKERVEIARSRDILDVARELNMDLVRSGKNYRWKEHDSLVISPDKNLWKWFSRHQGGDVIALVETLKEVDFNQAIDFLNDGDFKEYTHQVRSVEAFNYYLKPYEQEFNEGRDYLKQERGLSDETIDFFVNQDVIGQANAKLDYFSEATEARSAIEPVIVFKSLDSSGELVGATLQGIQEDWVKWPKHGYAKVIMRNSDPMTGVHVDIGQPNRLVFAESPIDLMSYYELNKDKLQDVRLVSMDGLKESTISRHLAQLEAELSNRQLTWSAEQLSEALKVAIDRGYFNDGKHQDLITLAVDNDEAGRTFIQELRELGAPINADLPELQSGQDKTDWNDALKSSKIDNSRLGRARRKLDRLQGELEEATHAAFDHQRQTNGQPMNDKRGGSAFFKRHEQLVDRAIAKTHEIEAQQDRIEKLEWQEANKAAGLNRSGSGLDLSVSNIPRIKEEIEKFNKGESVYTRDTIRKYKKRLVELEAMADFANKTQLSPGAQSLVEQGLVNQWQKQPTIYFVKGLRKVALELNEAGEFEVSSKYSPKSAEDQDRVNELVTVARHQEESEMSETLVTETHKEKSLEKTQGIENAEGTIGDFPEKQEAAPLPEAKESQPLNGLSPNQTQPQPLLHFTINGEGQSISKRHYHAISDKDLVKLNRYAGTLQQSASWYLNELADSEIYYFYQENSTIQTLQISFGKDKFQHLTGIFPYREGQSAEKTLEDFANGNGSFDTILLANKGAAFDKLKVLPELPAIVESDSFYFGDLSEVPKLHSLNLDKAIKSGDDDVILALRTVDNVTFPASLMKVRSGLKSQLAQSAEEKIILGVYRNRDGVIDQLSINEDYIKDGGQEMLDILKNKQYSEIGEEEVETVQSSSTEPEEMAASPVDIAGQTVDEIPVREITPENTAYVYSQARQNGEVLQHGELYWKEQAEALVASFREDNTIAFTSQKKLSKKEIAQRTEELLAEHPELEWTRPYSSAESFVDVRGIRQRIHQAGEPVLVEQAAETLVTATVFTRVLDAAYNVGVPDDLTNIPEEFHPAWNQYKTYAAAHGNELKEIVAAAEKDNLLDKTSSFYKDWTQDQIYYEQYHVRLEFAEDWKESGPQLPFNTTDLIDYRTFAEELYRQNNIWHPRHLESLKNEDPVRNNVYIPYTKVYFDIYAPGGELVKKDVRYSIADEDRPISQLLGLGYRRLEVYPALAAIDQEILEQLNQEEEIQTINQEIAPEVSEPVAEQTQEAAEELSEASNFTSPKQETRESLAKVVEEIVVQENSETPDVAHQSIASEQQEVSVASSSAEPIDYTKLTPYELSEVAFQKVREFTQSPEALMEYLEFMSKFPQLSPRNAALIQAQWPGANAVATYKQWQGMGETLGISPEDVYQMTTTYTNKRTGETREVVHDSLSVKAGEKAQIVLFRPIMEEMIPVFDAEGNQVKNDLGNPKFKSLKFATAEEKKLLKEGLLKSYHFQKRNVTTGEPLFTTYKVFELSQTTLKEEAYPKAMPNRHYNFEMDKVKAREVTEGLCDYAESLGVELIRDEANQYGLGNSKGRYYVNDQKIVLNKDNTAGEQIGTLIHELAHATLHDPKRAETYKDVSKSRKELEAEMTSHLVSKHFGLDTSEKAINYMATWTNNLSSLDDKQLTESMKRIHNTVSRIVKSVEKYTKPYGSNLQIGQQQGLSQKQTKDPKM